MALYIFFYLMFLITYLLRPTIKELKYSIKVANGDIDYLKGNIRDVITFQFLSNSYREFAFPYEGFIHSFPMGIRRHARDS